ncbi:MAG: hypothetical protein DMG80_10070 [Acidobacteria bacterium]|nr:MAG: hypothetical protein DMG80_10070 [Acidobacteriota bacterium]
MTISGIARPSSSPSVPSAPAWRSEPTLREVIALWFVTCLVFVTFVAVLRNFFQLVNDSGDSSAYMAVASAIRHWNFQGLTVKHFWGLPYAMAAFSLLTGVSERTALLVICFASSLASLALAQRLWGGWIASLFAISNFDWLQRSFVGGSEPLFVALIFGSFLAIRTDRWPLAALLAALATVTRPLGILLLVGIGVTLLWRRDWRRLAAATTIGLLIGALYVIPLMRYFHDPLATVHSYEGAAASASVPLFGIPFYAIIKGTLIHPAPVTNLILTFGWIFLVLIAVTAMLATSQFRSYARRHVSEIIFAGPYILSLYCYNYSHWARGAFPRFAIPIIPFVFLALGPWLPRWVPRDRRLLWVLAPVMSLLAASSALGVANVFGLIRRALA